MDRIFIHNLRTRCRIGVWARERKKKQDVILSIDLVTDLRKAGQGDRFQDAVDYHDLEKRVLRLAENSRYQLVEALAEAVASLCLKDKRIVEARVRVEKPAASKRAKSVGMEILRTKQD